MRYRTRDLVRRIPADRCGCGRTFDIYEGGIRGRVDDMKVVRGTNIYPRAIEEIVRHHADIEEFQVRLYTADGIRDEVEVLVECDGPGESEVESILAGLRSELANAHEGLRIGVRQVEHESLPRFELKAKRLLDERDVWGGKGEKKVM